MFDIADEETHEPFGEPWYRPAMSKGICTTGMGSYDCYWDAILVELFLEPFGPDDRE